MPLKILRQAKRHLKLYKSLRRDIFNILAHGRSSPRYAGKYCIQTDHITSYLTTPLSRSQSGKVLEGDWDLQTSKIELLPKFDYCVKHFKHGLSWEASGAYELMLDLLKSTERVDGCSNHSDILKRYVRLDKLFADCKADNRLKSRRELLPNNFREEGGIYVHFGRTGEPIFGAGGCHRLAIAKILNLPAIPIQIGAVHPDGLSAFKKISANNPIRATHQR